MNPRFVTDKKKYSELYNCLGEIRALTSNPNKQSESNLAVANPVDDMNWSSIYSIIAYLRLNARNPGAGWSIYFQLYDDDKRNIEHFQNKYGVYPFCDCSYISDVFEFYDIHKSQREMFGNQWSITGSEDHVVFSKDLSWFLVTDCTKDKSTIYFNSTDTDIVNIWKTEFLFEINNSEL